MMEKIKKILDGTCRKIIAGLKDHLLSCILVICILVVFTKSVSLGRPDYEDVLETMKLSVTVLISMLGFSVSIYVFLNNTFQTRRINNAYEKEVIDRFQMNKKKSLGVRIFFSVIVILMECLGFVYKTEMKTWLDSVSSKTERSICYVCFVVCIVITVINVILLGYFTYEVINYESGLSHLARDRRKQCEQGNCEEMKKGDFLNLVNNIEVLAERVIENHLHAKISNAYDSNLKRAICDGYTEPGEIKTREEFAEDYQKIIQYRNLLLQDKGITDSTKVNMGSQMLSVMNRLFQYYLKGELLTGVSISNLSIKNANLSKSSFSNSLLHKIVFKGNDTTLKNADFRNSTLNEITFEKADCENINFSDSKLIDVKFNTNMKLQRAVFSNADLTSMKVLGPEDKEGAPIELTHSNFERANLTFLDIYNVSFDFADLSNVRLVDSKIGASAQKQNNTTFEYADMVHADMLKCVIERCNFQNANLDNAILTYTKISHVNFAECRLQNASLSESTIEHCKFEKAYCTNLSLKGSRINHATFFYSTMTNVDLSGAALVDSYFTDAVCRDTLWVRTSIFNSHFERCVFAGARIVGETDKKTQIQACDFSYANFCNSAITNIEFHNCDFKSADFSSARLINVSFIDCKNMDSALTNNVWLSHVEYLGQQKSELVEPNKGWRYNDSAS